MIIGFTGTREGMTELQRKKCHEIILELDPIEIHDGCDMGADRQFFEIIDSLRTRSIIKTFGHPSTIHSRSYTKGRDFIYSPEDPLVRNHAIAGSSFHIIACPLQETEILRSGTWATIRYATKLGIPITIISPTAVITRINSKW